MQVHRRPRVDLLRKYNKASIAKDPAKPRSADIFKRLEKKGPAMPILSDK